MRNCKRSNAIYLSFSLLIKRDRRYRYYISIGLLRLQLARGDRGGMPVKVMIPDELASRLRSEGIPYGRSTLKQEVLHRLLTWTPEGHSRAILGPYEGHARAIEGPQDVPNDSEPVDPSDRAETLDYMPADGDATNPKSNFQIRRRKQTAFVCEQWAAMFPKAPPLTVAAAKDLLRAADDSTFTVLSAFEVTVRKGVEHPGTLSYALKVAKSTAEQFKAAPDAPRPRTPRKPASADEAPWGGEPEKRPMTAEELDKFNYYAAMGREMFGSEGRSGDDS